MYGDEVVGELGEDPHGHGSAPEMGPGASFRRNGTADEQRTVLDLAPGLHGAQRGASPSDTVIRPSTTAALAPTRTRAGSARPPSSSPRLVTTMVLPAPVSPVTAVKPGDSSTTASSMTPSDRIRISSNTDMTLRGPGAGVRRAPVPDSLMRV